MNGKKNLKNKEVNIFWKKLSKFLLIIFPCLLIWTIPVKAFAAFNSSYIIPDDQFMAKEAMNEAEIQSFLEEKNSYLKNYTIPYDALIGPNNNMNVNGWRASKVIYNVAQWYSTNPQVIMVTLQKEQSLITTSYLNQIGMDWAMGYGCPDGGGCNNNYKGFAAQVDWGTWQLRWNMDKANAGDTAVSPYLTGNTIIIDSVSTYLENGATASLYRYTPHFHGNQNFYNLYVGWFVPYNYEFISAINPPSVFGAGQYAWGRVTLRNTGSATWYNDSNGGPNPVRLNVRSGNNLASDDGSWVGSTRIKMTTPQVPSGEWANFDFTLKIPPSLGTYSIAFVPILENSGDFKDVGMQFTVKTAPWLAYRYVGSDLLSIMEKGKVYNGQMVLQNMGSAIWNSDANDPYFFHPFRLMVIGGESFYNSETWAGPTRIKMTTPTVKYGEYTYFNFKFQPTTNGNYSIKIIPIIENLSSLADTGMQFGVAVVGDGAVYRFWSDSKQNHFYTASPAERDYIGTYLQNIWRYEGVAYIAYNAAINEAIPVYRFWSDQKQGHFYTASWDEREFVVKNYPGIWKLEGVAFYVLSPSSGIGTPVYRFWSDRKQTHFYTTSSGEKDYIIRTYPSSVWRYEGIAWYTPGS